MRLFNTATPAVERMNDMAATELQVRAIGSHLKIGTFKMITFKELVEELVEKSLY